MPKASSGPLKSVVGWVGGIAGGVLTAVLIAHFVTPKPEPVTLDVNGYVLDSMTHDTVRNADVTLTLNGVSGHQRTDATGKYRIILTEPVSQPVMTNISVVAPGYQLFQNTFAISPPGGYNEVLVDKTPHKAHPAPSTGTASPQHGEASQAEETPAQPPEAPRAMILVKPFPEGFIKRAAEVTSRVATH